MRGRNASKFFFVVLCWAYNAPPINQGALPAPVFGHSKCARNRAATSTPERLRAQTGAAPFAAPPVAWPPSMRPMSAADHRGRTHAPRGVLLALAVVAAVAALPLLAYRSVNAVSQGQKEVRQWASVVLLADRGGRPERRRGG